MMEISFVLFICLVSAAVLAGAGLVFLLVLPGIRRVHEREKAELERDLSTITERLSAREEQIGFLNAGAEKNSREISLLTDSVKGESERRAAAEEKNSRIPDLEFILKAREEEIGVFANRTRRFFRSSRNWKPASSRNKNLPRRNSRC